MDRNETPTIKNEPGTSSTYKRLPSFRTPRDLKLSDFQTSKLPLANVSKKVYVPNLNVQRKKPSEELIKIPASTDKATSKSDEKPKRERPKKKATNYIQSTGVFSEGLAPSIKTGRWTSRFSESSDSTMLHRPKVKTHKDPVKVDKHAEEYLLKELLREDFIDDPSILPDMKHCPVRLPLKNFVGEFFKKEEDDFKTGIEKLTVEPCAEVKEEPGDSPESVSEMKPRSLSEMAPLTIPQLLRVSTDRSFIFFQLPHVLPKERVFVPTGNRGHQPPATNNQPEEKERNMLRKLPAGKIGKLQIMKSGRARLVLGDVKFYIEPGLQPSFKQDLMAAELNASTHSGDLINIGNITSHMIVSPDWHQLLSA